MKTPIYILLAIAVPTLTGCGSMLQTSSTSDLYAIHNRTEIAKLETAKAELAKAEAEAERARYEARLAELVAAEAASAVSEQESGEGKYARQIVMFDEYDYYVRPVIYVANPDPWYRGWRYDPWYAWNYPRGGYWDPWGGPAYNYYGWNYGWGSGWGYHGHYGWDWGLYGYGWNHGWGYGDYGHHHGPAAPSKNVIHRDTDRTYANGYRTPGSAGSGTSSGVNRESTSMGGRNSVRNIAAPVSGTVSNTAYPGRSNYVNGGQSGNAGAKGYSGGRNSSVTTVPASNYNSGRSSESGRVYNSSGGNSSYNPSSSGSANAGRTSYSPSSSNGSSAAFSGSSGSSSSYSGGGRNSSSSSSSSGSSRNAGRSR